jgi:predicted DNA-binding protein
MKTKMRQISIKLPNALVTALDEAATKSHRTRANVIQQAAEYYLNDFEDISSNKALRRKQRGINCAPQSAGSQPAFAPRGGELNPQRLNLNEYESKTEKMVINLFKCFLTNWNLSAMELRCLSHFGHGKCRNYKNY